MFFADLKMADEGITIPYPPLFDHMRRNHGFVDARGRPELAARIAEGAESPEMKKLLIELAQPSSKIFTVGCDLGAEILNDEELPYTAGGYVQIMDMAYSGCTPDYYARLAGKVADALNASSQDHDWRVHFELTPVAFKVDGSSDMTGSLWIWFHAFADSGKRARHSRETLVATLRVSLVEASRILLR